MDTNKINVNLYGGKSFIKGVKETPLEADIIYCDQAENCQLYKQGKCLRCRKAFFNESCKYGRKETVKGYTSRAAKYYDFKKKYQEDPQYNKLNCQRGATIVQMGDWVFVNMIYDDNHLFVTTGHFFIEREKLNDLSKDGILYHILTRRPRSWIGNELIKDYPEKIVPDLCLELRKNFLELAKEFFGKYPELDTAPNYVGKRAYMKTLADGSIIEDCHGCKWLIKDGKAYCDNYKVSISGIFYSSTKKQITVELSGEEICEITDNSQVNENTKFA